MSELPRGQRNSAWGPGFWAGFLACAVVLAVAVPVLNLWVPSNSAVAIPDYLVPLLGTASRVSEVLRGKKGLSMTMVQRLRARFRMPAELLLPPVRKISTRRGAKRVAA